VLLSSYRERAMRHEACGACSAKCSKIVASNGLIGGGADSPETEFMLMLA